MLQVLFHGAEGPVNLPVGQTAQVALKILKSPVSSVELFYKQHAWLVTQVCVKAWPSLSLSHTSLHTFSLSLSLSLSGSTGEHAEPRRH